MAVEVRMEGGETLDPFDRQDITQFPASHLEGKALEGGWKVVKRLDRLPGATGGCFSVGYIVSGPGGKTAFMKALDFSHALTQPDAPQALQFLLETYLFERDLLRLCTDKGLDRVARSIGEGTVSVPEAGILGNVSYLLFEMADGDVRSQVDLSKQFDQAFCLRALHHIATGLWQLHKQEVAHQDLKPSNVLVFEGNISRVADLGRAASKTRNAPHGGLIVPGDPRYAPPELIYQHVIEDWHVRRLGCDLYHLGSMIAFLFARTSMTAELLRHIPATHRPGTWAGTYQEALPVIKMAFGEAIEDLKREIEPGVAEPLCELVVQLCDPDLGRRGNPKGRGNKAMQFSIETYVSKFDRMASRAEFDLKRKASGL